MTDLEAFFFCISRTRNKGHQVPDMAMLGLMLEGGGLGGTDCQRNIISALSLPDRG